MLIKLGPVRCFNTCNPCLSLWLTSLPQWQQEINASVAHFFERQPKKAWTGGSGWKRAAEAGSMQTVVNSPATPPEQEEELYSHQACQRTSADFHQTHRLQHLIHRAEKDAPPGASDTDPRTVMSRFQWIIVFVSDCYDVSWRIFSSRQLSHLFSCVSTHRYVRFLVTSYSHLGKPRQPFQESLPSGMWTPEQMKIVSSELLGGRSDDDLLWTFQKNSNVKKYTKLLITIHRLELHPFQELWEQCCREEGAPDLGLTYRNSQPNTLAGQLRVTSSPIPQMRVCGLWDEVGVPTQNPHQHWEDRQRNPWPQGGMGPSVPKSHQWRV